MLLSYHELVDLVLAGVIDVPLENVHDCPVNGTSIDIRISGSLLVEAHPDLSRPESHVVDVSDKANLRLPAFEKIEVDPVSGYELRPGGCALGVTVERFRLPYDISCEMKLKSSIARCFLNNMLATWCDPGWGYETEGDTRLTLEIHNCLLWHYFRLYPGMKIGQMVFFRSKPVPRDRSYAVRGQYNGTADVAECRGVK